MGLFNAVGSGLKGLFGEGFADRAAIASALVNDDPSAVATIRAQQAKSKGDADKAALAQQSMLHAFAALKALGMPDDQAYSIASDPTASADFFAKRNALQQYSASGGSSYDPVTGKSQMAPSRHEYQGSVFDVGGGVPGEKAQVTPQHEGYQMVTPQPGAPMIPVNSFTGVANMPGSYQPPAPAPAGNDLRSQAIDAIQRGADPAAVLKRMQQMMQGGQTGSAPSATFP